MHKMASQIAVVRRARQFFDKLKDLFKEANLWTHKCTQKY